MLLTLWATPRSTSTAFEWMMRQRGGFECHHEPWNELYYYGVDRVSDRDAHVEARPGHDYAAVWHELEEVGFESLHRLFHRIADRDGTPPPPPTDPDRRRRCRGAHLT